jgi:hypothetical protein
MPRLERGRTKDRSGHRGRSRLGMTGIATERARSLAGLPQEAALLPSHRRADSSFAQRKTAFKRDVRGASADRRGTHSHTIPPLRVLGCLRGAGPARSREQTPGADRGSTRSQQGAASSLQHARVLSAEPCISARPSEQPPPPRRPLLIPRSKVRILHGPFAKSLQNTDFLTPWPGMGAKRGQQTGQHRLL